MMVIVKANQQFAKKTATDLLIRPVDASAPCPILSAFSAERVGSQSHDLRAASIGGNVEFEAERCWRAIQEREESAGFFYGVATTGVFCRPDCASRRPLRTNVKFFATTQEARRAGFRPCKRCSPETAPADAVKKIAAHLEANLDRAVSLAELGRLVKLSPFTVQRIFKQQMGASPLGYQRALRAGSLRNRLKEGGTVTNAIYEAGFGSSSRAYEGAALGMTPGRFAQGGRGERIGFTATQTAFGWVLVGATSRGLCWLSLAGSESEAEETLRAEFPAAELQRDPSLGLWVDAALAVIEGGEAKPKAKGSPTELDLRGTAFQLRVWQALQEIPRGETRSYSQLAREMGDPKSTRAVARACATNRVALVVPCHRVVGVTGSLTGYRWGVERKRAILEAERGLPRTS
jgi:AraC family transcriptional regulator of adaptative response/methylated-DNA-[protein]-cysteine methyltransferase